VAVAGLLHSVHRQRAHGVDRTAIELAHPLGQVGRGWEGLPVASGERGVVRCLREVAGGVIDGDGASLLELADRSEPAREALAACFAEWEAYLVDGFTAMREDGLISREADPAELAVTVMTALQGGLLLAQTTREVRPLELALDMAIAHAGRYRIG
jgi:TetR/AcrR family transcriptional repressor of nem operon